MSASSDSIANRSGMRETYGTSSFASRITSSTEPGSVKRYTPRIMQGVRERAGAALHRMYRGHPALTVVRHEEVDNYAITVFRKSAS